MTGRPFRTVEIADPGLTAGGIVHATVSSRAMGRRCDCTFWAPPDHYGPLPLVVLLHGVYGSHWAWTAKGAAHLIAERLVRDGEVEPFALAMPSDGLIGLGSGYVQQAAADVPAWILGEVSTLGEMVVDGVEAAAPIALVGLSMGGFGALRLGAVAGSGRVAAAAGLSSITHLDQMPLFGADLSEAGVTPGQESVLDAILAGRRRLHIDCGRDDLLIEHNRELHRALSDEAVDHQWVEHEGGHDWTYWQTHLPAALRFASGALSDRA